MENNTSILGFIFQHRKAVFSSTIIGALLGLTITFFIPKKFNSTAVVYPYSAYSKNDIVENPQFGYEIETEQLMQLMESQTMRDRTIKKFNLQKYYDIDTSRPAWRSELTLKYVEDITFFRSKYLSVVVNVQTTDPVFSAKIANYQIEEINNYRQEIFAKNRSNELEGSKKMLDKIQSNISALKDSIYTIKTDKSEVLYAFIQNLDNDNYDASAFADDPRLEDILDNYVSEYKRLQIAREDYKRKFEKFAMPMPSVYVIDRAEPNFKKVSPSFVINILLGALTLMILSITVLLVRNKWLALKEDLNRK
jgi:uncharacterized protein involved in exopolysaccharide biosynthesis